MIKDQPSIWKFTQCDKGILMVNSLCHFDLPECSMQIFQFLETQNQSGECRLWSGFRAVYGNTCWHMISYSVILNTQTKATVTIQKLTKKL